MKNFKKTLIAAIAVLFIVFVIPSCVWQQNMDEQCVILKFGRMSRTITEPGIHCKLPYPLEERVTYTKRLIMYDTPEETVITLDKKSIMFDTIAFFTITDPAKFYVKFKSQQNAQNWIDDSIYSGIRNEVGKITFDDVIYEKRDNAIDFALKQVNNNSDGLGIHVNSIYLKRTSIPRTNEQAVFQSMIAERRQQAAQIRAEGDAMSKKIKSDADRIYVTKISAAQEKAEDIKGQADKKAQAMIDETMKAAPDLYMYMKKLSFYKDVIPGTPIILKSEGALSDIKGEK